jgi:serine protease AprX
MRASRLFLLALMMLATWPAIAADRILEERFPQGTELVRVIVQYRAEGAEEKVRATLADTKRFHRSLRSVNGGSMTITRDELSRLEGDPDIEQIVPDHEVYVTMNYARPALGGDKAVSLGYTGKGVGIAVIDSGVVKHPDFEKRVVYSESFVGYSIQKRDWNDVDGYGHANNVIGILAGDGGVSKAGGLGVNYAGIAPGANIISLRVLDANGKGYDSDVIAAIDRAIALKSQYNIRVMNLSIGRPVYQSYTKDPLCLAVEKAWKAGIVVVVAAGNLGRDNSWSNGGYGTITAPGNDPYVITVGAMRDQSTTARTDDVLATYSSKGPTVIDRIVKPDIVAPGNRIVATASFMGSLESNYPSNWVPRGTYSAYSSMTGASDYFQLSGTSMAAPMVSGAAALLIQKTPTLTPDDVKLRLMKTAYKTYPTYSSGVDAATGKSYSTQYDIFAIGAGYLDIAAALNSSDKANGTGTARSPRAVKNSNGTITLGFDTGTIWNKSVTWGTSVVWGTNVFVSGTSVLWGSSVMWGTSGSTANSVMWGTTSPYANSVMWGTADTVASQAVLIQGDK